MENNLNNNFQNNLNTFDSKPSPIDFNNSNNINHKNSSILIFHQNIQHFPSRSLALEIVIDEIKPDIIILSEHKLKDTEINHAKIKNFSVKAAHCRTTCKGGGVMILSNNRIKVKHIEFPSIKNIITDKEFECCIVECKSKKNCFVLIGVYRTPGNVYDNIFCEKLSMVLDTVRKKYVNIIAAGDINIDVR